MPNVKISDAADAGTLLASDMLPLARSGNTNAYHATMSEVAAFASTSLASGAYGNVGRNLLHNPLFNVAQRGAGPWGGGPILDRWFVIVNLDTAGFQQGQLADTSRAEIGDEQANNSLGSTVAGNAGAAALTFMVQRIENVRRLAGKTVTVSFWSNASTGLKLGVNIQQVFGTGGSPSAPVVALATGNAITLGTTYVRYSTTIAIPSISGKTLGTNNDDYTALELWWSSGSTNNARAGNIGVQSGTINLWGVQLEVGSVATPLEKPDPQQDLAKCQRFYQVGTFELWGYQVATGVVVVSNAFSVQMRAPPTIAPNITTSSNLTSLSASAESNVSVRVQATAVATSGFSLGGNYSADADL